MLQKIKQLIRDIVKEELPGAVTAHIKSNFVMKPDHNYIIVVGSDEEAAEMSVAFRKYFDTAGSPHVIIVSADKFDVISFGKPLDK